MSKRVLIVESDTWLSDGIGLVLEKVGYDVTCADNPYAAIDKIDDKTPSVIIMNLLLDIASGIGLLHELQTYVDTAKIPIIVYTKNDSLTAEDLQSYGVRRVLDGRRMKPNDILRAVRSVGGEN